MNVNYCMFWNPIKHRMLELYSHIFEADDDLLTQSPKYHLPDIHPPQGLRLLLMKSKWAFRL